MDSTNQKAKERRDINQQIQDFFAVGGAIKHIEKGVAKVDHTKTVTPRQRQSIANTRL